MDTMFDDHQGDDLDQKKDAFLTGDLDDDIVDEDDLDVNDDGDSDDADDDDDAEGLYGPDTAYFMQEKYEDGSWSM